MVSRAVLKAVRLTAGENRTIWDPICADFATGADLVRLIACIETLVQSALGAQIGVTPPTQHEADHLLSEAYLELVPFVREKLTVHRAAR